MKKSSTQNNHSPGVSHWKFIRGSHFLNAKLAGSITPVEVLEAVDRNTRRACHELEQSSPLLVVKGLHSSPKQLDSGVLGGVLAIVSVVSPVCDVNLGDATNQ